LLSNPLYKLLVKNKHIHTLSDNDAREMLSFKKYAGEF
jgi:hypothetical protein